MAIGFEKYGSEDELKANPIPHLSNVYTQINKDLKAEKEQNKTDIKDRAKAYFNRLENPEGGRRFIPIEAELTPHGRK